LTLTLTGKHGLEQPVVVREIGGGRYGLVVGFRRFAAVTVLGWDLIPAFVRELDDYEARLANGRENLERRDLSFWEECLLIRDTFPEDVLIARIQEAMNKNYSWVRPRRQIWELPQPIIDLVEEGGLSAKDVSEQLKQGPEARDAAGDQAQKAKDRGEDKKQRRKAATTRRRVQGRTNMGRMMNIVADKSLVSDPNIHNLLLWAMGDIDKTELAAKLNVDAALFTSIED
jgi:ParB/RepB/Spo0J family partition protein